MTNTEGDDVTRDKQQAPPDVRTLMPNPDVKLCPECITAYRNGIAPGETACEDGIPLDRSYHFDRPEYAVKSKRRCTECGREIGRHHSTDCIHPGYVELGETLPWKE